ncbi:unnamed protein product [Rhodiola kirilowii]
MGHLSIKLIISCFNFGALRNAVTRNHTRGHYHLILSWHEVFVAGFDVVCEFHWKAPFLRSV